LDLIAKSGETESSEPSGYVKECSREALHVVGDLSEQLGKYLVDILKIFERDGA